MRYRGSVIRPPSEATSLILQVTYGCSHNTCDFCGTYLDKPFGMRPFAEIAEDVRGLAAPIKTATRRVFLADGDALALATAKLVRILELLHEELPRLERVSSYANAQNLLHKSVAELRELRVRGLQLVYLGLESGDDETLAAMHKGVTVAQQIEACHRASAAGIELSLTAILGLAGSERSLTHARATGRAFSAIDPQYIGVLSLIVVPGTALAARVASGDFAVPDPLTMLRELREMIATTDVSDCLFRSNHASNYLPVGGHLPEDKDALVAALDDVLANPGAVALRPESWRLL